MLTSFQLAATPDVFIDHSTAATESAMALFPLVLLLAPGLIITIFYAIVLRTEKFQKRYVAHLVVGAALTLAAVAGGIHVATASEQARSEAEAASVAYTAEVTDWIGSDYGIDLTAAVTQRLVDGESFVTVYDGLPTTISVIETTDGHIAIVDENRAPLIPTR